MSVRRLRFCGWRHLYFCDPVWIISSAVLVQLLLHHFDSFVELRVLIGILVVFHGDIRCNAYAVDVAVIRRVVMGCRHFYRTAVLQLPGLLLDALAVGLRADNRADAVILHGSGALAVFSLTSTTRGI